MGIKSSIEFPVWDDYHQVVVVVDKGSGCRHLESNDFQFHPSKIFGVRGPTRGMVNLVRKTLTLDP